MISSDIDVVENLFLNDQPANWTVYWTLCIVCAVVVMDGLFRGYRTPPKRSTSGPNLSPFSTSPSQLQEVTLGANGTLADQTKISPMRGRSVKEYDEQLTTLKKENFNLKLRIYFLEERMGSTYRPEDKDNIIRKNIEYKVEIETLRKELDEKQDLLCQAVKALELEDEEHKRVLAGKDSQLHELTERASDLELEVKKLTQANDELLASQEQVMNSSTQMYTQAFGLQSENTRAKEEIEQLQQHITDLETQLAEERDHSAVLENEAREADCLQQRCNNLETELEERNEKLKELVAELEQNGHTLSSYNLRIRTLEDALISANSDMNFKHEELVHREKILHDQATEIDELRRLVEESHVLCDKEQRQTENLKTAVMSRDNTIADLESKWEKSKSVIRNLEAKLDSAGHETKRQRDEIQTMKLQRRVKINESDNKVSPRKLRPNSTNSMCSSTDNGDNSTSTDAKDTVNDVETVTVLKQEMKEKDYKLSELEHEQLKAYNLIQQFIAKTKSLEKELAGAKVNLTRKNQQIEELQSRTANGRVTGLKPMSLPSQFDNTSGRREEKENSVEDSDETKATEEMKKCAAGDATALEWEKHVEELMEVIEEKEQQLDLFKEQCKHMTATLKERDNRIVELENEVDELRSELSMINVKLDAMTGEKLDTSTEKAEVVSTWQRVTDEKDKKIEQLESEVRKHTFNLQGIVNTELWDKNREIEKLQNRFTEKLRVKEAEMKQLEKDITTKDLQLKMLKEKISELGVQVNLPCSLLTSNYNIDHSAEPQEEMSVLKEQLRISTEERKYLHQTVDELRQQLRNTPERDSDNKIMQLKHEYAMLQMEYDKSEKLRLETVNLCSMLTTRLEELAHFLDSLLKLKSVLGVLGSKQRSAIKQAIDQSLDLSKSLSVSMMNEDQSLAQLSSISGLLNTTQTSVNMSIFEPWQADEFEQKGNVSLTFNSHLSRPKDVYQNDMLSEQTEIIKVLRAQIETMKKEIEVRDMELNKQNAMDQILSSDGHELKNDNDLVEALIDLQNKSALTKKTIDILSPNKIYQSLLAEKSGSSLKTHLLDNQSESEAWSEPDRCVSQARIGLDAETLKNNSTPNLNRSRSNKSASLEGTTTTSESTEADDPGKAHNRTPSKRGSGSIESRHTVNLLQDHLMIMENKLKEKENEILALQANVMELTNRTLEVKLHMAEEVAKIRNEKMDVEKLLKELEEKVKNVDVQGTEQLIKLENALEEKEDALIDTKLQLETLKSKLELVEDTLHAKDKEYAERLQEKHTECQAKLQENENKWQARIQKVESEAEQHLVEIHQTMEHLKAQYEAEYIQKTELTKHVQEMEVMFNELESLKDILKSTEAKVKNMEENELTLKQKYEESENVHREKIIALKREVNEATLRTSQAVLERTKISNEKLKLEAEIRKLETLNGERGKELDEKDKELINMRNNLQKQLSQTEQQKSCLQLRVSELETMNAELHNRLVKLQTTGGNENVWTKSRSTSPPKISELLANYRVVGKHSLGTRLTFTRQKSDMSGYASEDVLTDDNDGGVLNRSAPETFHWFNQANANVVSNGTDVRTAATSSPDLGIESDQGRFSSLETNVATRPLLQTLELTASMNNLLSADQLDNVGHYCNIIAHKTLEKENVDLKKIVSRLEAGLERTRSQLSVINQNKRQVEKAVCKQIHKTSIVLRQARANLDSGSENDIPKRK